MLVVFVVGAVVLMVGATACQFVAASVSSPLRWYKSLPHGSVNLNGKMEDAQADLKSRSLTGA
jgi:hypothetical protein